MTHKSTRLYNQDDKVDQLSPMSLNAFVSVSVMELALGGSATNRATPSKFIWSVVWFLREKC